MSSRKLWISTLLVLPFVTACNDDDDGNGGPPPPPAQVDFTSTLDSAQEVPAPVSGTRVRVTVTNNAPELGTFQSPVWVGFHDGTFEVFDVAAAASTDLERLAEDSDAEPLQATFDAQGGVDVQGLLSGELGPTLGPIAPGETVSGIFELVPTATTSRFMSFATAILPSNDAFLGNDDPQAHPIYDVAGNFVATDFVVAGPDALDAGTEVNDELTTNTNFFGQTVPNTGVAESGTVALHAGYLAPGGGGVLDDPDFADADFTAVGYEFLSFTFEELPAAPPPTGLATVHLSASGTTVDYVVTATNLSGPAIAAHFHEAPAGTPGPVVLDIGDTIVVNEDGNFRAEGSLPAPADFADDLRDGNIYVNVHTELNPDGELRGQILTDEAFSAELDMAQETPTPLTGSAVRVTARNRAPDEGTFQSPLWLGFHDGDFEIHDVGMPASMFFPASAALERLAEDGNVDPITQEFTDQAEGTTQGTLTGQLGPVGDEIAPGETVTGVFRLDPLAETSRFFSYGTMILPSNDAFLANDDPSAHPIFDATGAFVATDFTVAGAGALDAGTEVNDELTTNTNFFGQTAPNTGVDESGNVALHAGFLPAGGGGILDDPDFAAADFTAVGYEFLDVRFTEADEGDPPTGTVIATLNDSETQIDFTVFAANLSGPATAMHFHEALPGTPGPIVLDLGNSFEVNENGVLSASGSEAVTSDFVEALRAGDIYLNIHTALNPTGEIRGQLILGE